MVIFIKKLMRLKKQQKLNYVECFYFMCFILIQIKKKIYYFYLKKLFLFNNIYNTIIVVFYTLIKNKYNLNHITISF